MTFVYCDAPKGYVTRISKTNSIHLPEEVRYINNRFLTILTEVYRTRMIMDHTDSIIQKPKGVLRIMDYNRKDLIPSSFTRESGKNKRKRNNITSFLEE